MYILVQRYTVCTHHHQCTISTPMQHSHRNFNLERIGFQIKFTEIIIYIWNKWIVCSSPSKRASFAHSRRSRWSTVIKLINNSHLPSAWKCGKSAFVAFVVYDICCAAVILLSKSAHIKRLKLSKRDIERDEFFKWFNEKWSKWWDMIQTNLLAFNTMLMSMRTKQKQWAWIYWTRTNLCAVWWLRHCINSCVSFVSFGLIWLVTN